MPAKHAHFVGDAFPETPSPTFLSMSLPSSSGPQTPPFAAGSSLTGHALDKIHYALGINQPSPFLFCIQPLQSYPTLTQHAYPSMHVLSEPTTIPPVPSMIHGHSLSTSTMEDRHTTNKHQAHQCS